MLFRLVVVVVTLVLLSEHALGKPKKFPGWCKKNGRLYTISNNDCSCYHERNLYNGKHGLHSCPNGEVFNTERCACHKARNFKCPGSKANACPRAGVAYEEIQVGYGYCITHDNKYTISNPDCTCFHQKDLTNGNNGYHRCPAGLTFNPAVCVCDYPWNSYCYGSQTDICPDSPDSGVCDDSSIPDGLSCTRINPITGTENGNLYEIKSRDCTCFKQTDLSNGNFGYHCCPDGLTFNPAVCVCDWAYNSICHEELIPETDQQCRDQCGICNLADIIFVVDGSGSINNNHPGNFEKIRTFLEDFVAQMSIGEDKTRIGLMQFSHTTQIETEFFLTGDITAINDGIANMVYQNGQSTRINLALKHAREVMFSQANGARDPTMNDIQQHIFFLTDGKQVGSGDVDAEAALNHAAGFITHAIGVGDGFLLSQLEVIASQPSSTYVDDIDTFDDLAALAEELEC